MSDESLRDTTRDPVAWAAIDAHGRVVFTAPSAAACGGVEPLTPRRIVPLYRDPPPPTLTDAERAFLRRLQPRKLPFASYSTVISPEDRKLVFGLLARLGGAS